VSGQQINGLQDHYRNFLRNFSIRSMIHVYQEFQVLYFIFVSFFHPISVDRE